MKKEKILFLALLIVLVGLFGLCGFSLFQCFVFDSGDEFGSHFMEIMYLFLHLIMIAIVFYLVFRAFKIKPSLIQLMTLDVDGNRMTKSFVISLILSVFFFFIGIYSTLRLCGLKTPPLDIFPNGLIHDLMNAGYFLGAISLTFFIYPFIHEKEDIKLADVIDE